MSGNIINIAIIFNYYEDMRIHMSTCDSYSITNRSSKYCSEGVYYNYTYYSIENINNLLGCSFSGAKFLSGSYESSVINTVLSKIRD